MSQYRTESETHHHAIKKFLMIPFFIQKKILNDPFLRGYLTCNPRRIISRLYLTIGWGTVERRSIRPRESLSSRGDWSVCCLYSCYLERRQGRGAQTPLTWKQAHCT